MIFSQCVSLLGFFKKLSLSRSGYLSENISVEEWWFALSEQCYDKYPSGPTRFGLWERAGGKNYDLLTKGTGKEIWDDALKKIRNGKVDVDPQKLLKEMSKDYSSSIELNQLRDTYR